jgi:2-polyprenyl-6-methoxyphenol hydroxylase-like FAD-dependent oxidoreductase
VNDKNLHVAVIGGGMGGLCLAQGLKKAGVSVAVYERDQAPDSRAQGYRIHIDPQGSTALQLCLPKDLWDIFEATGGVFSEGFSLITEQLQELLSLRMNNREPVSSAARHRSVSRIILRRILLAGLDDVVHFGKRFLRYEEGEGGRITAYFEDGSSAEADVLVAADGVNSRVRQQYLPMANPIDTGVVGIGGRVPLSDGVLALAPVQLLNGPMIVMPPAPCCLFMAIWKRATPAEHLLRPIGIDKPLAGDEDYLIMALGGRTTYFDLPNDTEAVSKSALKDLLRRQAAGWHPDLRKLIEIVDERELFVNRLRTSRPMAQWKTSRITLLGDAIHSMTPYRGIGGNIALKDAALLVTKLAGANKGEKPTIDAIAEYEASMREYAFAAVEDSRRAMEQFTGEKKAPVFPMIKAGMRLVNVMPTLKKKLMRGAA